MSKHAYHARRRRPDTYDGEPREQRDDSTRRRRPRRRKGPPTWVSLLMTIVVAYIPIGLGMYLGGRRLVALGDGAAPAPATAAAPALPPAPNAGQPNIIVVGGGQPAGYPYPTLPYGYAPAMPGMPAGGVPDYGQSVAEQVRKEVGKLMAEKTARDLIAMPDGGASALPRAGTLAADAERLLRNDPVQLAGGDHRRLPNAYTSTALATPLAAKVYATDSALNQNWGRSVKIPQNVASQLRTIAIRNPDTENWFNARVLTEMATNEEKKAQNPDAPAPSLDDILRKMAEASYAARQYDRTARIYAEMASLNMPLSNVELLRWSKAVELSTADPVEGAEGALKVLDLIRANEPDNPMVLGECARLLVVARRFADASNIYRRLVELEPGVRDWRLMRAKTLVWANDPLQALPLIQQLHLETPEDWELRALLADLLLADKQYANAIPYLQDLMNRNPDDQAMRVRYINTLLALQRFGDAIELLTPLVRTFPNDLVLRRKLADAYLADGHEHPESFQKSAEQFAIYLEAEPGNLEARLYYADALQAAGHFGDAAREFGVCLDKQPENLRIRFNRARALMADQQFAEGAKEFAALVKAEPTSEHAVQLAPQEVKDSWEGLVVCLRMDNRRAEAYREAAAYLKLHPDDSAMHFLAGDLVMEQKDWDRAAAHYRAVLRGKSDGGAKDETLRFDAELALARVLSWQEDYYAAEKHYVALLEKRPENARVKREYARLLGWDRRYDDSLRIYRQLVAENPDSPELYEEWMFQDASYNKRYGAAIAHLQQWALVEPPDGEPDVWGQLAQAHWAQWQWDEAEMAASEMFKRKPGDPDTSASLAHAWLVLDSWALRGEFFWNYRDSNDETGEHRNRKTNVTYAYLKGQLGKWVGRHFVARANIQQEWWDFGALGGIGGGDADATRYNIEGSWYGNPWLNATLALGFRRFNSHGGDFTVADGVDEDGNAVERTYRDNGGKDQFLWNLTVNAALFNEAMYGTFYARRNEHYDNWFNFIDDLYTTDFGVDLRWHYQKWTTYLRAQDSIYNDDNNRISFGVGQEYQLYDRANSQFAIRGDFDSWWWRNEEPTYFSPEWYFQFAVGVQGRYYFQRNVRQWGSLERYFDYGYTFTIDRYKEIGHSFRAGYHQDVTERLNWEVWGEAGIGTAYNDYKFGANINYLFGGGCETTDTTKPAPAPRIRTAPKVEKYKEDCEPERRASPRYMPMPKQETCTVVSVQGCPTGLCQVGKPVEPNCSPCQAAADELSTLRERRRLELNAAYGGGATQMASSPTAADRPRAYVRGSAPHPAATPSPVRAAMPVDVPAPDGASGTVSFTPSVPAGTATPAAPSTWQMAAPSAPEPGITFHPAMSAPAPSAAGSAGLPGWTPPEPSIQGVPSPAAALTRPPDQVPALPDMPSNFTLPGETTPFQSLAAPTQVAPNPSVLPSAGTSRPGVARPAAPAEVPATPKAPSPGVPLPPAPPVPAPDAGGAAPDVAGPNTLGSNLPAPNTWTLPPESVSEGILGRGRNQAETLSSPSMARSLPATVTPPPPSMNLPSPVMPPPNAAAQLPGWFHDDEAPAAKPLSRVAPTPERGHFADDAFLPPMPSVASPVASLPPMNSEPAAPALPSHRIPSDTRLSLSRSHGRLPGTDLGSEAALVSGPSGAMDAKRGPASTALLGVSPSEFQ